MSSTAPLLVGLASSLFLLAALTLTAFVKVSVILMIVRNAIGLPQVPSNMIIMALSVFISVLISAPVFSAALEVISARADSIEDFNDMLALGQSALRPFQDFVALNVDPLHVDVFLGVAEEVWEGSSLTAESDSLIIQVPAFLITELSEAFEIGFLLYLPFVAVDLAVTTILMALGMQLVQPNIIAVPFKLLLFVFIDGWGRLAEGLVFMYA